MGLSSTLFTGLSGLDVNQTRLNVVGNNIANVNTTAFKTSRVNFAPQFYITDSSGGPADGDFGGTNPSQHGLGATVSAVQTDFSPGAIQTTGKETDLAIDGNGFFVVQNGKDQDFTRDGSFTLNPQNALVTTGGAFVQGYGVDSQGNIIPGKLGNIVLPKGVLTKAEASANATFTGVLNAKGVDSTGASILNSVALTNADGSAAPQMTDDLVNLRQYDANQPNGVGAAAFHDGDVLTLSGVALGANNGSILPTLSLTVTPTTTAQDLSNFLTQGFGIDTNAALPGAPTPGVTLGAIANQAANTSTLIITGNAGAANKLQFAGSGLTVTTGSNTPASFKLQAGQDAAGNVDGAIGESLTTPIKVFDSLGTPLTINLTISKVGSTTNAGTSWQFIATTSDDTDSNAFDPANLTPGLVVGEGSIQFDQNGNYVSSQNNSIEITRAKNGASTPVNVSLDFHTMQALSGQATGFNAKADGQPIGTLSEFSIGPDGTVTGSFTNGLNGTLGQVAIATFANPEGLLDKGTNLYATGANSGNPQIGAPQQGDAGQIRQGSLEQSNVDLSAEFINLIVASTGFSAASRVITTADQLIQELLSAQR